MNITGMSEQLVVARIKQKGDSKCIPWKNLKDIILAHPDTKKKVDVFALSLYCLIVFPKALGHVDKFHSHFWKVDKVSYRVFPENYSPLKEIVATPGRDDISEEKWAAILQNLQEEGVEWRALWLLLDEILSRQFIPTTRGLAECEFSYKGDGCKKKIRKISNVWNQTRRMKRLAVGLGKTSKQWREEIREKKNKVDR
ncbi:hypothetical protein Gotur_031274, partial [Gossypium turneri]